MATARPEKTTPARAGKPLSSSVSEEGIARRAYELYLQRLGKHGGAIDDWLEAERVLRSEQLVNRDINAHLGRRGSE
jgi:hypothetical protein